MYLFPGTATQQQMKTYMSSSAIIMPDGSTANWWEAFLYMCEPHFKKAHNFEAMSFHRKDYLKFFNSDMDFQVNLIGECCLIVL